MEEWKEYKLHEIGRIVGGATPPTKDSANYDGEISWITPKDLSNFTGRYIQKGERSITQKGFESSSCQILPKGSILFSSRAPIGYIAIAANELCTNQGFKSIIPDNNLVNNLFLYYLLKYNKEEIEGLGSGTTFKEVSAKVMQNFDIKIPCIQTQKKIADILSSLDDKIELNKRINDNLEQQAQALFKSWFVDNPDSNWKKISLSEVASFVGGYSYTGKELTDFSNVAMATIKNFMRNGGFKAEGFKGINPSAKLKECHYANLFDILVAHTDLTQNADVIGNAELLLTCGKYNSIIFSMDLVKVLPKEIFPYSFLLAAMLKNKMFKAHSLGYINGTTVLHLNKKALPEFEIRKPSDSEAKIMNETLAPYYKRMAKLLQETDKLISLRDTLLPKLMSGEVKINETNN